MTNIPVFELSDVSYAYGGNGSALESVTLTIHPGESVALLGANGSGKSTLLKLLDGLYFPTRGELRAFHSPMSETAMNDKKTARSFHRRVGLLFQDPDAQLFLPTVWDEVAFAPLQMGISKKRVREVVSEALHKLGLYGLKDRPPYHLSEGEKKKVSLASILTLDPEVWLMDEPTASLDPRTQGWVMDFILELGERGRTTVIATHDLEIPELAAKTCYVLGQDHRILAQGPAAELFHREDILVQANLLHRHRHLHRDLAHSHPHGHGHTHTEGPHRHDGMEP